MILLCIFYPARSGTISHASPLKGRVPSKRHEIELQPKIRLTYMIIAYNSIICVYTYKSLDEFLDNMLDTWFGHGESMWRRRNRGIRTPPTAGGIPCQVPAAVRILGSAEGKISQN